MKRRTASKSSPPKRGRKSRCTCVFDWGVEFRLLPDGTVAAWVSHESQCPQARRRR